MANSDRGGARGGALGWLGLLILLSLSAGLAGCGREAAPGDGITMTDHRPRNLCGVLAVAWTEEGVVARGGQPDADEFGCLRARGFAAVVNLRAEAPEFDEAAAVATAGMAYLHLPLADDTAPAPAQVSEYMAFVSRHAPTFTHDSGGRGRAGVFDGIYLLWRGWPAAAVFERYIAFEAKIDCANGGNGQIQALHEIGAALGRGDAWPAAPDRYGSEWAGCPRPSYMAGWDYGEVVFPPPAAEVSE